MPCSYAEVAADSAPGDLVNFPSLDAEPRRYAFLPGPTALAGFTSHWPGARGSRRSRVVGRRFVPRLGGDLSLASAGGACTATAAPHAAVDEEDVETGAVAAEAGADDRNLRRASLWMSRVLLTRHMTQSHAEGVDWTYREPKW